MPSNKYIQKYKEKVQSGDKKKALSSRKRKEEENAGLFTGIGKQISAKFS